MKDYSAMSDFEINKLVAHKIYGGYETAEGCVFVDASGDGENLILISGFYDPCNNPADAWPIIHHNRIGISPSGEIWHAYASGEDFVCSISNPLRSAMIVYLQMMEQKS